VVQLLSIARHYLSIARHYLSIARHYLSIARHYLSIARHYLSIARHCYRSPVIVIDRPPLLSRAVPRQSSQQLINNDNRCWWRVRLQRTLPPLPPYLIIIIIQLYLCTKGY
jgi:hypothetical protein